MSAQANAASGPSDKPEDDLPIQQFIVRYLPDSPEFKDEQALQLSLDRVAEKLADAQGRPLKLLHVRRMALDADVVATDRPIDADLAQVLMERFASERSVQVIEADVWLRGLMNPNDADYPRQWDFYDPVGGANVPRAWDMSTGARQTVAVIDSGFLGHADLDGNLAPGYDFISTTNGGNGGSSDGDGRDPNPYDNSNVQHGMHVAGTIAAVTNNGQGVAGVAFNAKIVHARVLGNGGYGKLSDIADAVVWASGGAVPGVPQIADRAQVINMSLGGSGHCNWAYQQAIDSAVARGTTVVVAAGNNNADASNFQPASCNNVIAVAANTIQGNRASYSNYGAAIDITAPGGDGSLGVYSTVGNNGYGYKAGTSMAAPHVAGVAALIGSVKYQTPAQIEAVIKATARPGPAGCPNGCGAGILDAGAAVARVGTVDISPILQMLLLDN
ncbi:S8 family serine peptidase [Lysobacter sp. 2RAB21]